MSGEQSSPIVLEFVRSAGARLDGSVYTVCSDNNTEVYSIILCVFYSNNPNMAIGHAGNLDPLSLGFWHWRSCDESCCSGRVRSTAAESVHCGAPSGVLGLSVYLSNTVTSGMTRPCTTHPPSPQSSAVGVDYGPTGLSLATKRRPPMTRRQGDEGTRRIGKGVLDRSALLCYM